MVPSKKEDFTFAATGAVGECDDGTKMLRQFDAQYDELVILEKALSRR